MMKLKRFVKVGKTFTSTAEGYGLVYWQWSWRFWGHRNLTVMYSIYRRNVRQVQFSIGFIGDTWPEREKV